MGFFRLNLQVFGWRRWNLPDGNRSQDGAQTRTQANVHIYTRTQKRAEKEIEKEMGKYTTAPSRLGGLPVGPVGAALHSQDRRHLPSICACVFPFLLLLLLVVSFRDRGRSCSRVRALCKDSELMLT